MTASGPALIWVFWVAAGLLLLVATTATLWPLLRGGGVQAQRLAWLAAVAVPLLATTLYHRIGAPAALGPDALPASPHRMNDESMVAAIELLTTRLASQPDDGAGWLLLARSHEAMGRWPDAAAAYRQALRLAPDDAVLMADLADVVASVQGGALAGEPAALADRAVRIEPTLAKALALKAMAEFQAGRADEAVRWWQRLADGQPADSPAARVAREGMARVGASATTTKP
jgi:cytochrome c-type biogenesis protein CcmH